MRVQDVYPLVTTDKLAEVRDFYTRQLGATVAFEASWFVLLALEGERPFSLAFMSPDHPSRPPGPEAFDGRGVVLTLQVEDARAAHERLTGAGVPIHHELSEEPWGQRRFMVQDPAGVLLDVVEQIEPAQGFWERYAGPAGSGSG